MHTESQTGGAGVEAAQLKQRILSSKSKPVPSGGKVYYVSNSGSNSFDGISETTPFASVEPVKNIELYPGDAVLFERNSLFRLSEMFWLKPGVFYGAYGFGEKPLFLGSLKNYAKESIWKKDEVTDVWKTELKGEQRASLISFDGDSSIGRWCYEKEEMSSDGDFYHDVKNGTLYLYCKDGNPEKVFNEIEIATTGIAFRASFIDGMSIDNLSFKYFAQGTFLFGECNGITVTDCVMGWQGGKIFEMRNGKPLRYGNAAEFWYQCRNITVESCYIYQIYDAAVTFQGYGDGGPDFRNIKFDNNLIEYCSMNIEYWAGNTGDKIPPHIENISYTGNIIRFCGYGWGGMQRFDKHNQALLLGWNRKYTDITDFVIKDNILDCSNGYYIYMYGPKEQEGIVLINNSYYQKPSDNTNEYTDIIKGIPSKANSIEDFKKYISYFDENPKTVGWID